VLISFKLLTLRRHQIFSIFSQYFISMSKTARYIVSVIAILILVFLIWYFSNIVVYILASLVLALVGRPIFNLLERFRFKKFYLPAGLRALITLLLLITVILSFFGIFIPLIVSKVNDLSAIDPQRLLQEFSAPIAAFENLVNKYKIQPGSYFSIEELMQRLMSKINVRQVAGVFGSLAGWLGNISVAFFAIAFITFFFLKDEKMFSRNFMLLIPDKATQAVSNAMESISRLLSRYFLGVMVEVTAVIFLSTIGLMIIGFPLKDALLVGFLAGIFNIIPYLGPIIGTVLGVFTGLITFLTRTGDVNLLVSAALIIVVFIIVQFIDNMFIQPYVYSNSVYAHPLEIFLVFLMAGSIGGLAGMILAVPAYTVMRVFAKEFLNNFKIVQSLTKNI
jgi:predicted PurR-regulated permease PerM